jgi:hypothetical protein
MAPTPKTAPARQASTSYDAMRARYSSPPVAHAPHTGTPSGEGPSYESPTSAADPVDTRHRQSAARFSDDDLEAYIDGAHRSMCAALTPGCQRFWWERLRELVMSRSQERIAEMERMKGLTRA